MSIIRVVAGTPYYVLMNANHPVGPTVLRLDTDIECSPIYGFSDKGSYDKFCANSQQTLKPYPLVKGYLRKQIDAPGDSLMLVVLDAAGPREPYLHAAAMESVLETQESRATHVTAAYRLRFDEEANAFRMEAESDVEEERFDETHA
jgi:hypothetical protein